MSAIIRSERLLTELDFARLSKLDNGHPPPELADSLGTADVIPPQEVPGDVVTMYSQVLILDSVSGTRQKLTLCYPEDAEPGQGFISVLSPVGMSLLGLRAGSRACWETPHGEDRRATVEAILFQPEASGDYTT